MKIIKGKKVFVTLLAIITVLFFVFGGTYAYWNSAHPRATCASCHEIEASFLTWNGSPHKDVHCIDCHGTALSSGMHSFKEKANMVLTHFSENVYPDEIKINELQVLEMSEKCSSCHKAEHADWQRGKHSATYARIFLEEKHNRDEQLYPDCLKCHGMFFNGTIGDLAEPLDTKGPWKLKDPDMADNPTIPCLACHKVHSGMPLTSLRNSSDTQSKDSNKVSLTHHFQLYDRKSQQHLSGNDVIMPLLYDASRPVKMSPDPRQNLCIQCHAPDPFHQVGTSDDRTPKGVHEGLSCLACHKPHSGETARSCGNCHPALSNCGLDVEKMNTTFSNPESPFNIHFVSCMDCHPYGVVRKNSYVLKGNR